MSSRLAFFKSKSFAGLKGRRKAIMGKQSVQRRMLQSLARREAQKVVARAGEEKYVDTTATAGGVTYSGYLAEFTAPSGGATANTRVGDKITVKRIEFQYEVIGYDGTDVMRVIIFKWNNDDGSYAPTVTGILDSGVVGGTNAPIAPYTWDNFKAKDFEILYDQVHSLSWGAPATSGTEVQTHRVKLFGRGLGSSADIQLNAGATTGKGKYGVLVISDSAVAGHPKFAWHARLVFTDM